MRIPFKPADLLSLSFIALLSALTLLFIPVVRSWGSLLGTYFLLAGLIFAFAIYRQRTETTRAAFYLYVGLTVGTIIVVFNSLGDLIPAARSGTYDTELIRIDHALFGVHPTVWMERLISPVLTAILQFAYISYYFMPITIGFVLIARGKQEKFEEALFGIVFCFYLSYIGYLLVPAVGPRFTLAHLQTADLKATPFIKIIQETLNGLEHNKTDAFPSGHTAIALTTLYYAWKCREKVLFGVLLPVVFALLFSTVYLRYHYVIDVLAGIALAAVTIALAPKLLNVLLRISGSSRNQRHDTT